MFLKSVCSFYGTFVSWCRKIPMDLILFLCRVGVAQVFWSSGRTKVVGWELFSLPDSTVYLFREEYGLPFPALMAQLSVLGEHIFPVMLVLGLGSRLAALGLFGMTVVIQMIYWDAFWTVHVWWFLVLLVLLAQGGGKWSLDHLLERWCGGRGSE